MTNVPTWDEYFMLIAETVSIRSKDPRTKVGCVIVDGDNRIVATGYNGMASGVDESQCDWTGNKYPYVIHAEANALLFARQSLSGCSLYTTLYPCSNCAKLICNSGISHVYYSSDKYGGTEDNEIARKLFNLCNIKTIQIGVGG